MSLNIGYSLISYVCYNLGMVMLYIIVIYRLSHKFEVCKHYNIGVALND